MDLLNSIQSGDSWRTIIYDIVNREHFDPWDIDIKALTDAYLQIIENIKIINFAIPGTVILVGSILLRLKSNALHNNTSEFEALLNADEDEADYEYDDYDQMPCSVASLDETKSIDSSILYIKRVPKRKVTLTELMMFLHRVIVRAEEKYKDIKEPAKNYAITLNKYDLRHMMKEVYNELKQLGNNVTFQNFLPEWTRENIVKYIFPVLHLADDNKISLEQKEWFGDIRLSII